MREVDWARVQFCDVEKILGVPVITLLKLNIRSFAANNIPDELQSVEAVKPGSRFLK